MVVEPGLDQLLDVIADMAPFDPIGVEPSESDFVSLDGSEMGQRLRVSLE